MENMLTKILKTEVSSIHDQGPVIRIQTENPSGKPRWIFVFNPFYKGHDPMKELIWETKNADGIRGFMIWVLFDKRLPCKLTHQVPERFFKFKPF